MPPSRPSTVEGLAGPRPGEAAKEIWLKVAQDPPHVHLGPSRKVDDTRTSTGAPDWMTRTNGVPEANRPEWDWITYNRYSHKRKAVTDDTATSFDAPDWFTPRLREIGAPALTQRYAKYVGRGGIQVHLKPLIEVDPYGVEHRPHMLPSPHPSAAFVPTPEEKAALDGVQPLPRLDRTTASLYGAGDVDHEFHAPRPRTRDRLGKTSAADLDNLDGPIVDPFGNTAQAGEADRTILRARSVGARMTRSNVNMEQTVGGTQFGLPGLDMPGSKVLVHEAPTSSYYAWRRAAIPEDVLHGIPGLGRGRPQHEPGVLVGHHALHHMRNTFGVNPAQHLGEPKAGLHHTLANATLSATGQPVRVPKLREPPLNWYNPKR